MSSGVSVSQGSDLITVKDLTPSGAITVKSLSPDSDVVEVQIGAVPGPKGDSPDKSIYSVRTIVATDSDLDLDASTATTFYLKLQSSVNLTVINWPNDSKSQRIAIYIEQDDVGNRIITWPSEAKWSYGQVPNLSFLPNSIDCVVLDTFDGGTTIFGGIVGLGYN